MRLLLWSAAVLLLVIVLTVLIILRRRGRTGDDLLASQMRTIGDPRPAGTATVRDLPAGVDDATWRRIGELAVTGREFQAIELLRTTTGCRLAEAKAVVDRLSLEPPGRPAAPEPD